MTFKKIFVSTVASSVLLACSFGLAKDGKYKGSDKNIEHRQAQAQAYVDSYKVKDGKNADRGVVYQYTIGDDNISLLTREGSFFGNSLGWDHFEVDGDRADWVKWADQIEYLNDDFSYMFSDYNLPSWLGGVYIYNMYGTQYIWGGGEFLNPYDGWRNSCDNTTTFIARTLAQHLFPNRDDRVNFAFWVDYAGYTQYGIAKYIADSSLPSEFSEIHWKHYADKEINGEKVNLSVYCNYKVSLRQWFNIVCINTGNGSLVPIYFEKVETVMGGDSFISQQSARAVTRCATCLSAYYQEGFGTDNTSEPTNQNIDVITDIGGDVNNYDIIDILD